MFNLDNKCTESVNILPNIIEIKEKKDDVCPVNWALDIVENAREKACGKSVMCRDGLFQIYVILKNAISGKGDSDDLELLIEIVEAMKSLGCDLTENVANLISASINNHREEWETHIKRKRCNALVCKAYYSVHIDPTKCLGNGLCLTTCEVGAISGSSGMISVIDNNKCTRCGKCYEVCPNEAIVKVGAKGMKVPDSPIPVGSFEDSSSGSRRRRRG